MLHRSLSGVADVGVVGAGPARNSWARRVHGVLDLPEISGKELHALGARGLDEHRSVREVRW